ncbi:DUF4912 domain-containing protein [Myxococcus llanfairpwllgwyngyllgogerychwyrndrobwllllantysiliogogogochensis]|uniref:DUF4912 domain-containing protein n=1 Tax=Myxococcus llanfairpwllgwyngyllgogerychwyrndrobwllllantysiliogogogochensis TaxID=2590453 RepID=A0A540WJE2_9BACT|nr:DUF4912 domain-containing protein [Myxococcus llanfairpwllgwyngyllgogerychwyrndrobwllllantysiliogogogochensis]TQF09142.1 DUF4912 domain-containing protein [Myxococcus llanfairpwllgwyngyllgogerychwyrndrobwllllantysiliogogogochensis]
MDDLKSVTVGSLRELARKHLGSGYSKLNKEELIAALAGFVPALAKLARLAGIELPRKRPAAKKASAEPAKAPKKPESTREVAAKAKVMTPSAKSKALTRTASKAAPPVKAPTVTSKAKGQPSAKAGPVSARPTAKAGVASSRAKAQPPVKVPAAPPKTKVAASSSKAKPQVESKAKVAASSSKAKPQVESKAKVAASSSEAKRQAEPKVKVAALSRAKPQVEPKVKVAASSSEAKRQDEPKVKVAASSSKAKRQDEAKVKVADAPSKAMVLVEPKVKAADASSKAKPQVEPKVKVAAEPSKAKPQVEPKAKVAAAPSKVKVAAASSEARPQFEPTAEMAASAKVKAQRAPKVSAAATTTSEAPTEVNRSTVSETEQEPAVAAKSVPSTGSDFPVESAVPIIETAKPADSLSADKPRAKTPRKAATEMSEQGRVSAPKRVAAKRASEKPDSPPSARPAHIVNFPPKPRGSRDTATFAEPEVETGARAEAAPATPSEPGSGTPPSVPPVEQHPAEPLIEGFFVARVRGEAEARRHHLQEQAASTSAPRVDAESEGLEPLPVEYQDDTALLLPRDPHTLFALWDFSPATRARAMHGLEEPRAVLRVFDGELLVREVDCALESRGYYIHGLSPGRPYRFEAHFVGHDGRNHRIGPSSNRVALPPAGVSTDTSVRFLRRPIPVEPEAPVVSPVATPTEENREREYVTWHRVNLPGSAGAKDIPVVHREGVGPGVPPSPGGPGAQVGSGTYLQGVERAPGASDQRYLASHRYLEAQERAAGASDMRYGDGVVQPTSSPHAFEYLELGQVRAPGASDQRYQDGAVRGEAQGVRPAYQYLDIGRAPGASDMRYAEPSQRAPANTGPEEFASAPRASDLNYFESPPRASGASDLRYFESPPRAHGASDRRYSDLSGNTTPGAVTHPSGTSEQDAHRKPPSGGGRS